MRRSALLASRRLRLEADWTLSIARWPASGVGEQFGVGSVVLAAQVLDGISEMEPSVFGSLPERPRCRPSG